MYARSAPIACAARIEPPFAIAPDSTIGPPKMRRTSPTSANGDVVPRVTARAGGDENQAVDARVERFLRVPDIDHIVQHDAAVAMHRVDDFPCRRAQAGDENRHLVLDADTHVLLEPLIRLMDDLIDRDRPDHRVRMRGLVRGERRLNLREPFVEPFRGARIERRK